MSNSSFLHLQCLEWYLECNRCSTNIHEREKEGGRKGERHREEGEGGREEKRKIGRKKKNGREEGQEKV